MCEPRPSQSKPAGTQLRDRTRSCEFLASTCDGKLQANSLAVGVAKVDTGLAPGFGQFAFLLLVFGEFFVGIGEGIARSEHGVTPGLFLFLAQRAEFVADLPDWAFDGLHFDEQITDFFEKVVKVVRAKHIGEPRGFQIFFTAADSSRRYATYHMFWDGIGLQKYVSGTSLAIGQ